MRSPLNAFFRIIEVGRNTNSYKFALARALVRMGTSHPFITKSDLAPLFVEYYWPLEVIYHVRQGIDPQKDPVVMRLIRDLVRSGQVTEGQELTNFQSKHPVEYLKLLANVARGAFDDVIARFHIVRSEPITPQVYTFVGRAGKVEDEIVLTDDGRSILKEYGPLIDYLAVSGWVRFTEASTTAPKLHEKIAGTRVRRRSLVAWRNALRALQDGKCFYGEGHDMSAPEVDHFLPWSYVLEDKTWNLVLSRRECNNAKRDRMPSTDALDLLIQRNGRLETGLEFGITEDNARFMRQFAEWRSRDLATHIKTLFDQAVADGFPQWGLTAGGPQMMVPTE